MKPVKLLLLIPHLGGGGAERVTALLAQHLDAACFETHIALISADAPGAVPMPATVRVHRMRRSRVRYAVFPLLRLIWSLRPDVILSGMAHLNFLVLSLRPILPVRTRILVRQNTTASLAASSRLTRTLYRHLYPTAARIICQSQAMAADLSQNFSIPTPKLAVLANPLRPLSETDPHRVLSSCSVTSIRQGWPSLLAVGRLSPEKGLDLLLQAMPALLKVYPSSTLTILGAGPSESALRKLSGELGILDRVSYAGYANPQDYYEQATLFVSSSRYEGLPNALLEAADSGLPIVATPSSAGVRDLLRNAPGTWLTPQITSDALARTLLAALETMKARSSPRYSHAFLAPHRTATAIRAYESLLVSVASAHGDPHP